MLKQIADQSALDPKCRQQFLSDIMVHESNMQTMPLALPPDLNITGGQFEAVSAGLYCCR